MSVDLDQLRNTLNVIPCSFNSSENVVSTTTTTTTTTALPLPIPYNHQPEAIAESGSLPAKEPSVFVTPISVTTAEPTEAPSEEPPLGTIEGASTGRAVDYRPAYPFNQFMAPLVKTARPRPTPKRTYSNGPIRYQTPQRGYNRGKFLSST